MALLTSVVISCQLWENWNSIYWWKKWLGNSAGCQLWPGY